MAEQRQQVKKLLIDFLDRRAKAIRSVRFSSLLINPFLIRMLARELGLTDARSIVEWLFRERIERGMVTAFGTTLEKIAKVFSEGTGTEGADIYKIKQGRHNYIQVKSGPNTVPKHLAVKSSELLHSALRRNRGAIAIFGMCYGNKQQVSGIVKKYITVPTLIGREFWEYISDDPSCIDEIYEIVEEAAREYKDPKGRRLQELIDEKLQELEAEFKRIYGESGPDMWRKLLLRNS